MAFPKRLLIEGEELVLSLRPHWIVLVGPVAITVLVLAGWIAVLPRLPQGGGHVLSWLTLGVGLAVLVVYPLRLFLRWWTSYFVVTTDRIIHRHGIIGKSSMEIPLEAINDVRFEQGVFERIIGAGDLIIESAGEFGREVFSDIRHPEQVQKTIYQHGEMNQQRAARGSAAASSSPLGDIERLANLRDRGALTPAEFETQKRKLLGQ